MRNNEIVGFKARMTRVIAFSLVFLFVFSLVPAKAFADEVSTPAGSAPISSDSSVDSGSVAKPMEEPVSPADESGKPADGTVDPEVVPDAKNPEIPEEKAKPDESKEKPKDDGAQPQPMSLGAGGFPTTFAPQRTIKQSLPRPDENSGALAYQHPIQVPAGRNGLQPDLALVYNSQANEEGALFGSGWTLNIPYIERINRKGSEKLFTETYFNSSLSGELVDLGSGNFGSKVDNAEFLTYTLSGNTWVVKDKKGTTYKFGNTAAARQDNSADTSKVYKWVLEEVRDLNDNYIKYEYFKDAGQIYPSKVKYTGSGAVDGIFEVEFLRQTRSDVLKFYKTGFIVTTNYRISEIQVKVNGTWVRKYSLAYATGDNDMRSLLNTISEAGQDESGAGSVSLPATDFDYQIHNTGWTQNASLTVPDALPFTYFSPSGSSDNGRDYGVRVVDVNGDGLQDIIRAEDEANNGTGIKRVYINNGSGWVWDTNWIIPTFFSVFKSDYGVRIIDVNGDGLPDLVRSSENNSYGQQRQTWLNNGTGWVAETTNWQAPIPFVYWWPNGSNQDYGVRLADVNGDGLVDMLWGQKDSPTATGVKRVYINNGSGWVWDQTNWTLPTFFVQAGVDYGSRVVDVNGDGLADIIRAIATDSGYVKEIYINNGTGWALDTNWVLDDALVFMFFQSNSFEHGHEYGVRLDDVNGDGLVDIVRGEDEANNGTGIRRVYINTGSGWVWDTAWSLPTWFSKIKSDYGVAFIDANGDGLMDLVRSIDTNLGPQNTVWLNNGNKADLMSRVTLPSGGRMDITYKATPLYTNGSVLLNPNLPQVLDTVYQLSNYDGLGLTATDTFKYEGGKYYFAGSYDRRLSGFHKVTKTDNANNMIATFYHQGDATNSTQGEFSDHQSKIGKPYRVEVADASGNIYAKFVNKWENYDLGSGRNFVKLTRATNLAYDGNSTHKDAAETNTYNDTNGNLIQQVSWGEVTGSDDGSFTDTGSDKFVTDISYAANVGLNILGLPSQETVTDQSAVKVREAKHYYDTLALGSVNKGNETKTEQWKTASTYVNSQKTYNSYGLVATSTDPRGKVTNYSYDTYNLYPATVTNPLTQATQFTYDYSLGKPKQVTDVNNLVFQTVYDGLDRVIEEKQPDLTTPATLVTKTTYTYTTQSVGNKVQKTDYLDGTNTVDSYVYTDGFDRAIQTRTEMEDANTFAVSDTVYNNIEQIAKQSLPYSSTGTAKTSPTVDTNMYNTFGYDAMYRVTSVQNAVGTISTVFDDWKTSVTDARGKVKHLYKDASDQLVRVDEVNSGNTYTTLYEYNGNGNLTKITDALSNIRNFTYDGLGRRLTAQDLHASADASFGTWTYSYDDSGNLTQTIDPKNQTVNYTFDDINRPLTEDFTGQAGTEVTYAYDTCTYGVGKLCSVTKSGANTSFLYTALGTPSREVKTIDAVNYQTDYTYDRQGNQLTIANPDSSQVKYTYNTAGQQETVQRKESTDGAFINVVTDFDYGPHGKVTYQANANGTATTNTYDATKLYRLSRKQTSGPGGGGGGSTTVTFYPTAGDGSIYKTSVTWDSTHDATSGTADYTSSTAYTRSGKSSIGAYQIERGFLPFDTSSLPDTATITDVKLKVYAESKLNNDNDGDDWVTVVQGSQPSTTSLSGADFDLAGSIDAPTEGIATAERKDITGITTGQYLIFTLNSTGQGWVSKTGSTKLALREGHDVIDSAFTGSNSQFNELKFRTAEYSGTSSDPILEVTYASSGPPAPTVIQDTTYTYDANGNVTQLVDASGTDTAKTVAYTYDDLNRLMSATATGVASGQQTYTYSYTYNAVGNILTRSESVAGGAAVTYTYAYEGNTGSRKENPHAVTKITPSTGSVVNYTYDNNGNLTTDGTWTHTWDYGNRLTGSSKTGVSVSYAYDHAGSRVKLVTPSKTTIVASPFYSKEGTQEVKYLLAGDGAVATIKGTGAGANAYIVHSDHLGSSSAISNNIGQLLELSDYFPYGGQRLNQTYNGFDDRKGYIGKDFDADTQLSYLEARYYNGTIGRFMSEDPEFWVIDEGFLSDPQLQNSYSYARNNPSTYLDENGKWPSLAQMRNAVSNTLNKVAAVVRSIPNIPTLGSPIPNPASKAINWMARETVAGALQDTAKVVSTTSSRKEKVIAGVMLATNIIPEGKGAKAISKVDDLAKAAKYITKVDDVIPEARQAHILLGDKTGGGHLFGAGIPGKSEFPASWNSQQIFHNGVDIATDPSLKWVFQPSKDSYIVKGIRDGIKMNVIIDKTKSIIKSIYPK